MNGIMNKAARPIIGGLEHGTNNFESKQLASVTVKKGIDFIKASVSELPETAQTAYGKLLNTATSRESRLLNRLA